QLAPDSVTQASIIALVIAMIGAATNLGTHRLNNVMGFPLALDNDKSDHDYSENCTWKRQKDIKRAIIEQFQRNPVYKRYLPTMSKDMKRTLEFYAGSIL